MCGYILWFLFCLSTAKCPGCGDSDIGTAFWHVSRGFCWGTDG